MSEGQNLTLGGAAADITRLFKYTLYNILLQRNVYPHDDFERESDGGVTHMAPSDPEVKQYVEKLMGPIEHWVKRKQIDRIAVAILAEDTLEVLERWTYFVEVKDDDMEIESSPEEIKRRQRAFRQQMGKLLVQIMNINNVLPILDPNNVTFNVYVYTVNGAEPQPNWASADDVPVIRDAEHARLADVDTSSCNVRSFVSYKKPKFY